MPVLYCWVMEKTSCRLCEATGSISGMLKPPFLTQQQHAEGSRVASWRVRLMWRGGWGVRNRNMGENSSHSPSSTPNRGKETSTMETELCNSSQKLWEFLPKDKILRHEWGEPPHGDNSSHPCLPTGLTRTRTLLHQLKRTKLHGHFSSPFYIHIWNTVDRSGNRSSKMREASTGICTNKWGSKNENVWHNSSWILVTQRRNMTLELNT